MVLSESKVFKDKEGKVLSDDKHFTCYYCRNLTPRTDAHYWYHGDQDDLVCGECAKHLRHTDTCYAGMNVYTGKR